MSKFLKVIVNLFLVCAILIAGALLVPPVAGISTTMVDSSMEGTNLPMGSVTYSKKISAMDVKAGDKILLDSDSTTYKAYVVKSAEASAGKCIVVDANDSKAEPEEKVLLNEVLKIGVTIPLIGYVMIAMRSVEGLIIIGLIILFVIILFILSELWKKNGEEDEEGTEEQTLEDESGEGTAILADSDTASVTAQDVYAEPVPVLTSDELARAVAEVQGTKESETVPEAVVERAEATEVLDAEVFETKEPKLDLSDLEGVVEDDRNSFVPVVRPTKEEILKKAKAAGEKPELIEHKELGVTIFDYSDLI